MSEARKKALADPAVRAKMSEAQQRRRNRACFHCGYRNTHALAPLDGIDGEFECKNEKLCEQRILRKKDEAA